MEYVIAFFGLLFIGCGLYLIRNARQTLKEAAIAKDWPRVSCQIRKSVVNEAYREGTTLYHAEIQYTYRVKGMSYSNDAISIGGEEGTSNRKYIATLCKKYPTNSTRQIVVNPKDPTESYLELSPSTSNSSLLGGIIFILAGFGILWIFHLIQSGVMMHVK